MGGLAEAVHDLLGAVLATRAKRTWLVTGTGDTVGMVDGFHRSPVAYVWPTSLALGAGGKRSIYLDLNHWIGLAKAFVGHKDGGRYLGLLEAARLAVERGQVIFPLAGQHYMEMSGIRSPRQREDIARVMMELSQFRTLLCRSLVMRLELEAVLDARVGRRAIPYVTLDLIGTGFGHAFGVNGQLQIRDALGSAPEAIRRDWPGGAEEHDRWLAKAQDMGEWMMLRGPQDEDLEDLAANGFDPAAARRGQEIRAQQEREQAERFDEDPRWRRGRIRDVVGARYLIVELMDMLNEGLEARAASLDDLFSDDHDAVRANVDEMPGGDVHVSLQVAAHRNPQSSWTPNDYFDIDALSLAVPYCDVVVTERRRARDLEWSGCPERLGTILLTSPEDLLGELDRS